MKIRWLVLGLVLTTRAGSQDTIAYTQETDELVISATRSAMSFRQIAQTVKSITAKDLEYSMPQTMADALQKTGGITVQKSQQGGGSPILRGFEANRILLVVDGVRLNNLIFRGGHLQNIITIDPNMLEKTEILFGPASVAYGSDALGGVIHVLSRKPALGLPKAFQSSVAARYSTSNQEKMIHYEGAWSGKRWAALLSGTYSDFGDLNGGRRKNGFYDHRYGYRYHYFNFENGKDVLKTNDKPWKQVGSGYWQTDWLGKIRYSSGKRTDHILNLQYSTSSDIPRYDRLTDPDKMTVLRNGDWYYGPQKRLLMSYSGEFKTGFPLRINLNYQQVEESRHNRRAGNPNLQSRFEKVEVLGFDLLHQSGNRVHQWIFGLDGQYESLHSSAFLENKTSGTRSPLDTRYPAGRNRMMRSGLYGMFTQVISERLALQEGLRFGFTSLNSRFGTKDFFDFPFDRVRQTHFTYSGNFGLSYNPGPDTKWGAVLASGFRVPNVDDLAKVFESTPGVLIVPNDALRPEKSLGLEFNYTHWGKDRRSQIQISSYLTYLFDAIITSPFRYLGQDSLWYNGVMSRVFANQNQNKARIAGLSLEGRTPVTDRILVQLVTAMTRGRILRKSGNTPLDHIPPLSGKVGLFYEENRFNLEFNSLFNGWKRLDQYLLNSEDNEAYATPDGMPAWLTINIYAGWQVSESTRLRLSLENLLDTSYRVFASGINASGRNLSVMIKTGF
ncbi:MAG TPA: TonB-dependent receptor [Saprospiraceae bacterium]|nr:TonB-dependent receptor [Saprospiraceae bacterium]HNT21103.1 TonB-dependent receptor [Saprospiraceae bacterium]